MRLDAFLLADAATAPPDSKLYIHGGGLTVIRTLAVPLSVPLALAIRLEVDEAEIRRSHEYVVSITDPDGQAFGPGYRLRFGPTGDVEPVAAGEERYIQLALSFGALTFPTFGIYTFALAVDGEPLREMTVPVVRLQQQPWRPQGPPSPPNREARRQRR